MNPIIKKARSNYEEFHKLSEGSASLNDIRKSSLGIVGWSKAFTNESIKLEEVKRMHEYLQRSEKANNILRCLQKYSEEPMNIRLHEYSKVSKIWNRIKKIVHQELKKTFNEDLYFTDMERNIYFLLLKSKFNQIAEELKDSDISDEADDADATLDSFDNYVMNHPSLLHLDV